MLTELASSAGGDVRPLRLLAGRPAGVRQAYISQLETGKKEGSIETLKAIASALSVDLDDLV